MTEREFVFWLKGYLAGQCDSQMKIDIEKILNQVTTKSQTYSGTLTDTYNNTIKWTNSNSDVWFNNKFGINGSDDHLS